jgi:hypothetical protein
MGQPNMVNSLDPQLSGLVDLGQTGHGVGVRHCTVPEILVTKLTGS